MLLCWMAFSLQWTGETARRIVLENAEPKMVRHRPALISLLLSLALLGPQVARAQDAGALDAPESKKGKFPLSASLTLENAVGLGTFVDNPDTGTMKMPYYALLLTMQGYWTISDEVQLRARFDLEKEITSSYKSTTVERHQIKPADLFLDVFDSNLFTERWLTGLKLEGDVRLYFPTSPESEYATRLVGLSGRLGLSRKLGGFTFLVGSRYIRHLLRETHPVVPDYAEHAADRPCLGGMAVDGGTMCGGAANLHTTLLHDLNVSYDFTPHLSATVTLLIYNRFSYAGEPDQLSSSYATGENQRDITWGIIDLSYQLNDWLTYSVGISSYQPAKTEDGQRLRFPFWDVEGRAENYTTFYLDIAGKI